MPGDVFEAVFLRNEFYRLRQRKIVGIFSISLLTGCFLLFTLIYLLMHPPAPKYIPVTLSGQVMPIFPLNQASQADADILEWATETAVAAFTYSFVDYREELQASSGFFTAGGWTQFLNALQSSNNLDAITAKSMVVSAQVINPPTLLKKGVLNNLFTWRVEVPILVTYQNDTQFTQQYNMVIMQIVRVSSLNAPKGIGIEQLVVSPIGSGG